MTPCLIRVPPAPFEGELAAHFLWPLEGTQQRFVPPSAADSHNVAAVKGDRLSASDALDASDTPSLRAGRRRRAATGPKRLPASSMQDRGIPLPSPTILGVSHYPAVCHHQRVTTGVQSDLPPPSRLLPAPPHWPARQPQ